MLRSVWGTARNRWEPVGRSCGEEHVPQATICKCAAREPQKRDANRCYDSRVAFAARFCRNAQGLQKAREFNHVVCSCLAGSFRIQQGGGTGGLLRRLPAYYFALCSSSVCILLLSKKDKSSIPPMPASPRPRNRPQPQPAPQNSSSANASANASPQRSPKRADAGLQAKSMQSSKQNGMRKSWNFAKVKPATMPTWQD